MPPGAPAIDRRRQGSAGRRARLFEPDDAAHVLAALLHYAINLATRSTALRLSGQADPWLPIREPLDAWREAHRFLSSADMLLPRIDEEGDGPAPDRVLSLGG